MKRNKRSVAQVLARCWQDPLKHETEAAGVRIWEKLQEELKKHDTSLLSLYGDGWSAPALKQREFQILTAASMLNNKGSLETIGNVVGNWVQGLKAAHIHVTLNVLQSRGLLTPVEFVDESGTTHYGYQMTEDGERALARAHAEKKVLTDAQVSVLEKGCPQ